MNILKNSNDRSTEYFEAKFTALSIQLILNNL